MGQFIDHLNTNKKYTCNAGMCAVTVYYGYEIFVYKILKRSVYKDLLKKMLGNVTGKHVLVYYMYIQL